MGFIRLVSVYQGDTAFTQILNGAYSTASDLVSCMSAAFAEAYMLPVPTSKTPATEAILIIRGATEFFSIGNKERIISNPATKLVLINC